MDKFFRGQENSYTGMPDHWIMHGGNIILKMEVRNLF